LQRKSREGIIHFYSFLSTFICSFKGRRWLFKPQKGGRPAELEAGEGGQTRAGKSKRVTVMDLSPNFLATVAGQFTAETYFYAFWKWRAVGGSSLRIARSDRAPGKTPLAGKTSDPGFPGAKNQDG
jgi:hypothetical protein